MSGAQGRAPIWLFVLLLMPAAWTFFASCVFVLIVAGSENDLQWAFALLPPAVFVLTCGGTVALQRGRSWLGVGLFVPTILLGAFLLLLAAWL